MNKGPQPDYQDPTSSYAQHMMLSWLHVTSHHTLHRSSLRLPVASWPLAAELNNSGHNIKLVKKWLVCLASYCTVAVHTPSIIILCWLLVWNHLWHCACSISTQFPLTIDAVLLHLAAGMNYGEGTITDRNILQQTGISDPSPFFKNMPSQSKGKVVLTPHVYPGTLSGEGCGLQGQNLC